MSAFTCFRVKNHLIFANFISNAIGVLVISFLSLTSDTTNSPDLMQLSQRTSAVFLPFSFLLPMVATLIYERPIRLYLNMLPDRRSLSEPIVLRARKRLLNEPFFLIGLDSVVWLTAAIIFTGLFWAHGADAETISQAFFQSIFTGLITVTIAFFVLEFVLQRKVVQYFFPEGGLSTTPGTLRIRIRTRLIALLFAINIVPLMAILADISKIFSMSEDLHQTLARIQLSIYFQIALFICVGLWMTFLVSSNLTRPFGEIINVLRNVKNGEFTHRVRVSSNDEIGYTGDAINEMTRGLVERDRMLHSLTLAREVQQNLLPKENLTVSGFDIAGKSVYCDETGGDYYDFIPIGDAGGNRIGIAIGDVSGHGIPSALLMATVRSSLRQRMTIPGSAAGIITDVNRRLVDDVEDSGQFMTLFFITLDAAAKKLTWVRAGHNPAIIYDPRSDTFDQLSGRGIALGIDGNWIYEENELSGLANGQVIFLSTDGVWEVRNQRGEMLGKKPIFDTIRQNAAATAPRIIDAMFDGLNTHIDGARIADDITSVVIKVQA